MPLVLIRLSIALAVLSLGVPLGAQSGVITTVAGTGTRGYSGDGGPASLAAISLANLRNDCDPARFEEMSHVSVDAGGNVYLADSGNHRIRRIAPNGTITAVAGSGLRPAINTSTCTPLGGAVEAGDNGQAAAAKLYGPAQALRLANGNLLICDQKNNRIRQVTPAGVITTVVGSNLHAFFAPNIPANLTPLDWPSSIAVDGEGRLYFAELHSHRIARVNADGRLQLVAGTGLPGNGPDGPAASSRLALPTHILFDRGGNLLVVEQGNHRVRRILANGTITTVAGNGAAGFSGDGAAATAAQLNQPNAVAEDAAGNLYIADMGNHRIRRVAIDGTISTIAGTGQIGRGADGIPATESPLNFPSSVAIDGNGDLLVVDWQNYLLRKVSLAARPVVAAGGVVNAASFRAGSVSPGALVSVFGTGLAPELQQASELPLPTVMAGTAVAVNGRRIPLVFVSPGQINAQVPYDLPAGEAKLTVTAAGATSAEETIRVLPAAPGLFPLAINQDFTRNSPENAEARGRVVTVYLTGIGRLDGEIGAGVAAPSTTLFRAALAASATVGGQEAPLLFLGLTPGFVGLAQANVQLPVGGAVGSALELVITVDQQASNPVAVAVR